MRDSTSAKVISLGRVARYYVVTEAELALISFLGNVQVFFGAVAGGVVGVAMTLTASLLAGLSWRGSDKTQLYVIVSLLWILGLVATAGMGWIASIAGRIRAQIMAESERL